MATPPSVTQKNNLLLQRCNGKSSIGDTAAYKKHPVHLLSETEGQ